MDDLVPRIVMECYDNGTTASDCAARLNAAGFDGFTWESVADMYEEIYCAMGGQMTREELERRATNLERRLDNDAFYSEDEEIEAEEELCQIYKVLQVMSKLEGK